MDKRTILLALIAVAILAIFLAISQKSSKKQEPEQTQEQRIQTLKGQIFKTEKPKGDLVIRYPEYEIAYLISNDQFLITINKPPYDQNKKMAENWFTSQGFKAEDLCKMNIFFISAKEVESPKTAQEKSPTGCVQ